MFTGCAILSGLTYTSEPPPPLPGSLLFNASNYLTVPSNTAFAFGSGIDFTVEGWVYLTSYGPGTITGGALIGTSSGASTGWYVNFGQDINSLRITSNASGTWTDNISVTTGNGVPLNTWTHIAFVRNGGSLVLYKNGVSVASMSGASAYNFTSPNNVAYIGYDNDGTYTRYVTGYITNLRVVKGTAVYTSTFSPSTSPLTAISNTSLLLNAFQGADFLKDTSTNNFTVTNNNGVTSSNVSPVTVEYLVVAGGGAGGNGENSLNNGGGGGAGGLLTASGFAVSTGSAITVTVGAGGSLNTSGSNSTVSTITTIGGGRAGGGLGNYSAQNGGSGGGGAASTRTTGGKGVYPGSSYLSQARQGYDGGNARGSAPYHGGGGGGAGGAGASTGEEGDGGIGVLSSITGTATYYAGGGGAGADANQGSGGLGGGGDGVWYNQGVPGFPGTVNTGGGGGGGASRPATEPGGLGGSGIVILRYPDTYANATVTGSPNVIYANANIIYRFWQSGTITL